MTHDSWLAGRFRGLVHALPFVGWMTRERRVLQIVRVFTNATTFLLGDIAFRLAETWLKHPLMPVILGCCVAVAWAIVSSDFIENRLRKRLLGYSYNPNVSAQCEWEGYTGPTEREYEAQWRAELWKIRAAWWGEKLDGSE